jgi:hypothetical protein
MKSASHVSGVFAKFGLAAIFVASVAACGGGDDAPATIAIADVPAVAISPTTASVATAALTAASSGYTFPAGVPALATTGTSTTIMFTAPATGATTPAFVLTAGTQSARGSMSYGSCIFNVTESTIPGLVAPTSITINPCAFDATTSGQTVPEGGTSTFTTTSSLILGTTSSSGTTVTVTVTNTNGVNTVTVNGGTLGTVTGTVTTGAGG